MPDRPRDPNLSLRLRGGCGFPRAGPVRGTSLGPNDDRVIHLDIAGNDRSAIESQAREMCRQVLANPVLEDFSVEVLE